jgi:DNA polymerase-3 subunit alpha
MPPPDSRPPRVAAPPRPAFSFRMPAPRDAVKAPMTASCVPLVARSSFSLLYGTASADDLAARAAVLGYPALALTDRDNFYGFVAFRKAARAAGILPLHGVELTGGPLPAMASGTVVGRMAGEESPAATPRAVLLLRTMAGYEAACRLITARQRDAAFDLAAALAAEIAAVPDGFHVLTDDTALARALHPHAAPNRLWLLLADPPRRAGDWRALAALSRELGRPLVASPDVAYLDESDRARHRLLTAIRHVDLVSRVDEGRLAPAGSALPPPSRILDRFRDFPAALVHNRVLREECAAFDFTLGRPIFPKCPLPPGETAYGQLFRLCLEGMRRRYGGLRPDALRRLGEELEVIERLGFPEYFLIVGDICRFAHGEGIPTVGRGSGAGSIVTYLLGITNVCPLQYRLYFERFLHDRRKDLPDLDIDLCWRRRDDVIDYVYRTYGADRVAMIATHNTFQARGAFRDAARAHGLSPEAIERLARRLPRMGRVDLDPERTGRVAGHDAAPGAGAAKPRGAGAGAERGEPVGRGAARGVGASRGEPDLEELVAAAQELVGTPRHLGIHCGGIVIGDRPLTSYVPLEEATKGIVVTQYEMHAIEAVGLVKIDLLGNRAISVLSEGVTHVEALGGPRIDLSELRDGDAATAELLSKGDALGVFQLESPGMRNLLRQLGTRDLNGAIAALSLIRPGPAGSGMKERFVRRARGLEEVAYLDPRLEPLLADTYGVLLYEEDVMAVGALLAGLSLTEGDLLRRAIAEIESDGGEAAVRDPWIRRAVRSGTDPAVAEEGWRQLRRFGAYAFCKAHAAGYGVLAWQGAYLKAHWPAAFAVAILNNHTAMYDPRVHLEDARRHGVAIRLPCVNRSTREYRLEVDVPGGADAPRGAAAPAAGGADAPRGAAGASTAPVTAGAAPAAGVADAPRGAAGAAIAPVTAGAAPAAGPAASRGAIRIGLGRVRQLTDAVIDRTLAGRPFAGLADWVSRVRPSFREAEHLILAGGFDVFGRVRPQLLCELRLTWAGLLREARRLVASSMSASAAAERTATGTDGPVSGAPTFAAASGLLFEVPIDARVPDLPDFDPAERIREEFRVLELTADRNAMSLFDTTGYLKAEQLETRRGRRVSMAGIVAAQRRVRTKRGDYMLFLTLEDETGLFECTLFPPAWKRYAVLLRDIGPYIVEGRAEDQYGAVTVTVERLARWG